VPLKENYLVCDLIRDLDVPAVIIAKAGLGTLNHTLLTEKYALDYGIKVRGVIINAFRNKELAEKTNPEVLEKLLETPLLGVVPFIRDVKSRKSLQRFSSLLEKNIDLNALFKEKSSSTQRLAGQDKEFIWHPFTQMQDWLKEKPLIIEEARGCYLKDTDGKWYLDGVSSLWVNVHGHRKKEIDSAVKRQLNKVAHSTMLGLSNRPAIELAKELIRLAPAGLKKVFYSDSGSSAVEIALKLAYQYWQQRKEKRTKFIHLENSYHGDTLGAVSVGGISLFHQAYKNLLFASYSVDSPYCYRCPKDKTYPLCNFECLDKLKEVLSRDSSSIAGLVVEPLVQAAGGIIVWPEGVYRKMSRLCKQYGVLLIADEVAVGIGRTGMMFASEQEKVAPDILCIGKGITAGYLPLAATLTTQRIFDGFLGEYKEKKTFFHGHTYTGNPLACSAALANFALFKKEKTLERLQPKINFLKEELEKFKGLNHVGDIRQKGFMAGIELVKDRTTKEPYSWEEKIGVKVCQKARDYGVILRPLGSVIVFMPAFAINKEELVELLDATYRAVASVTAIS